MRDARNKLSTVVEAARKGASQIVTRHGKPTVMVLPASEYARLCPKPPPKGRRSIVEHLRGRGKFKFEGAALKQRDLP